jgi:quinol monooxygenase YgiN
MIRHIVFFNAKNLDDIDTIGEGLQLLAEIPNAMRFEVARNIGSDPIAQDRVDWVVYAEFKDEAALAAYKAHPIYQASIAKVRPLRELRLAVDFESALPA